MLHVQATELHVQVQILYTICITVTTYNFVERSWATTLLHVCMYLYPRWSGHVKSNAGKWKSGVVYCLRFEKCQMSNDLFVVLSNCCFESVLILMMKWCLPVCQFGIYQNFKTTWSIQQECAQIYIHGTHILCTTWIYFVTCVITYNSSATGCCTTFMHYNIHDSCSNEAGERVNPHHVNVSYM